MNTLTIFVLVIAMCVGLNEAGCAHNRVEIHNQLGPGEYLEISCGGPTRTVMHTLQFNDPPLVITFHDVGWPHITKWKCQLMHGFNLATYYDVQVYRSVSAIKKCGQFRSWIAKPDGIWFTRDHRKPAGKALDWKKR
ncbi:unnamed protein product [Microthlaspi erraticum]|uniref:Uncharacterized protein n=1 Tax=Microthlaspi erraticum TaxID=1685480 RepID=A0A6D2JXV1_9BRAS|nr:unnamed protein product [Microthlaspi erraticum]